MTMFFAVIAGAALIVYIVTSIMIIDILKKRGEKINFIFINLLIPFYAHKYKKMTAAETGKPGSLFYYWIVSINTALVFGIAAVVSKVS